MNLPGTRADDLIVGGKLRDARALDPAGEKVTHILPGDTRNQLFKIVDRGILAAVFVQVRFQDLVEFRITKRFTKAADKRERPCRT
jgi:hypothetical protein